MPPPPPPPLSPFPSFKAFYTCAALRIQLMSASASASAAPKSSSFAMAQEVFEEGGFDAVLEMLSSRTSVMQATPPRPPPPHHHPPPADCPVCYPSHRYRSKPRCSCGSSLRATLAPVTSWAAAEYNASCSSLHPAQAIPPPIVQFFSQPLPLHSSHTSCAAAAADPRKNCAGALSSLVRHDDACALALQAGHTHVACHMRCAAHSPQVFLPPWPTLCPARTATQATSRACCSPHTPALTPWHSHPGTHTPALTPRGSSEAALRCHIALCVQRLKRL
jgi:hypothetical protein